MLSIGIKELFEAGVHFGHQTRRWNPKMKPYIYEARNGIHLIDLQKTIKQLESACGFIGKVLRGGGTVLFVGTKKQAQQVIRETAEACGQPYVADRWLGGQLTNLNTVKRSLGKLKKIEQMEADGTMGNYVKQEQARLRRVKNRLLKNLGGVRELDKAPDVIFIVDLKREHNAVAEARKLRIPLWRWSTPTATRTWWIIPSPAMTTPSDPSASSSTPSPKSAPKRRPSTSPSRAHASTNRTRPQLNPRQLPKLRPPLTSLPLIRPPRNPRRR